MAAYGNVVLDRKLLEVEEVKLELVLQQRVDPLHPVFVVGTCCRCCRVCVNVIVVRWSVVELVVVVVVIVVVVVFVVVVVVVPNAAKVRLMEPARVARCRCQDGENQTSVTASPPKAILAPDYEHRDPTHLPNLGALSASDLHIVQATIRMQCPEHVSRLLQGSLPYIALVLSNLLTSNALEHISTNVLPG